MALRNRTEVKAVVTSWTPILDLEATHKPDLRDEILNNCLFRKDVSDSQTATGTTKILDFDGFDYIEVTPQIDNCVYTLNNIKQGEIKYLKITKTALKTITFANATNQAYDQGYLDSLTFISYTLINKDGAILAIPLTLDIEAATRAEARSIIGNVKIITPVRIGDITENTIWSEFDIGDWNMDGVITLSVPIAAIGNDDVREVSVIIRRDDDSGVIGKTYSLEKSGDWAISAGNTIILTRVTAGFFDDSGFDKTSFNRGWISIRHKL